MKAFPLQFFPGQFKRVIAAGVISGAVDEWQWKHAQRLMQAGVAA